MHTLPRERCRRRRRCRRTPQRVAAASGLAGRGASRSGRGSSTGRKGHVCAWRWVPEGEARRAEGHAPQAAGGVSAESRRAWPKGGQHRNANSRAANCISWGCREVQVVSRWQVHMPTKTGHVSGYRGAAARHRRGRERSGRPCAGRCSRPSELLLPQVGAEQRGAPGLVATLKPTPGLGCHPRPPGPCHPTTTQLPAHSYDMPCLPARRHHLEAQLKGMRG